MSDTIARARRLMLRAGAWIDRSGPGGADYALRLAPTRSARITLTLDETAFRALIDEPGLRTRPGGGWFARSPTTPSATASVGRPGVIEGHRDTIEIDGRIVRRRANLGETPIAWLARRRDPSGRPWLTLAQVAAGERLRADAETALAGPSVTMRWDALPRSGGGKSARVEPSDRALSAARRVETALIACGPRLRPIVVAVCIHSSALQLAEQDLGLRRRQGKTLLKQGLQALAEHYGVG